ncbi:MAG: tail fiber domain-containing protein, partial [Aeromonas veronii]
ASAPGRAQLYCANGQESKSLLLSPTTPSFHPGTDNEIGLGLKNNRFTTIWATGLTCQFDDTSQPQVRVVNSLHNGMMQVSTAGNFGLYDTTYSKWMLATRHDEPSAFMHFPVAISGDFKPTANNTYNLGSESAVWSNGYFKNAPITVSDATKKTGLRDASELENAAFGEIARLPSVWQWLGKYQTEGDEARLHSGPTVQAAIAIMQKYGLDWTKYSAFCHDKIAAKEAVYDHFSAEYETVPDEFPVIYDKEDGTIISRTKQRLVREAYSLEISPAIEEGEIYRFRKEELVWWCIRALANQFDGIESRLAMLEGG